MEAAMKKKGDVMKSNSKLNSVNGLIEEMGADRVYELIQSGIKYERQRERQRESNAKRREEMKAIREFAIEKGFRI